VLLQSWSLSASHSATFCACGGFSSNPACDFVAVPTMISCWPRFGIFLVPTIYQGAAVVDDVTAFINDGTTESQTKGYQSRIKKARLQPCEQTSPAAVTFIAYGAKAYLRPRICEDQSTSADRKGWRQSVVSSSDGSCVCTPPDLKITA
jgi:hypothetical protein